MRSGFNVASTWPIIIMPSTSRSSIVRQDVPGCIDRKVAFVFRWIRIASKKGRVAYWLSHVGYCWVLGCTVSVSAETGLISTVAGDGFTDTKGHGRFSGDGGLATAASLNHPSGVFMDNSGSLYIADLANHRIRMIDESGIITTVAGNGILGFAGDGGLATEASLSHPTNLFVDESSHLYIADSGNSRIRMVDGSGLITTVAGNGAFDFSGDGGPATRAALFYPNGVFLDRLDNIYISDGDNHRIRMVEALSGMITTVAGVGRHESHESHVFLGDGGLATEAHVSFVAGVFIDGAGHLYMVDSSHHRIRKVEASSGMITTVAGDGFRDKRGYGRFSGDGGLATEASLNYPRKVFVDGAGHLYIPDSANHRIRRVEGIPVATHIKDESPPEVPGSLGLSANYPNPFNAATVIRFALSEAEKVELSVFNLAGQQVATLVEGVRESGAYAVNWDGRDDAGRALASGVYLYRLQTDEGRIETRKLVLVR